MITALAVLCGVGLDLLLGEPRRFHPLVGFGRIARSVEAALYRPSRIAGCSALIVTVVPPVLVAAALARLAHVGAVAEIVLLYLALGYRSLREHAQAVTTALLAGDLQLARTKVARMVSRDTAAMTPRQVTQATIESVLENGNDAVFGALFWFIVAGAPGVVCYRLANTLDAMWGYRNARYERFGWAAARFDDVLNFLPARLTALSYALGGSTVAALACWRRQAPAWDSPNAGPVMAAGAGALRVRLGGPACYQGHWHKRPRLGLGRLSQSCDIETALKLLHRSLCLWLGVLLIASALGAFVLTAGEN